MLKQLVKEIKKAFRHRESQSLCQILQDRKRRYVIDRLDNDRKMFYIKKIISSTI